MQNSNFFVDTGRARHVLTLFEKVDTALLPFYLDLMAHLADHGIPAPRRARHATAACFGTLNGRPAALFSRLSGASVLNPTSAHCAAIGRTMAQLHLAGSDFPAPPHPRGPDWIATTAARVMPFLSAGDAAMLAAELACQREHTATLPGG